MDENERQLRMEETSQAQLRGQEMQVLFERRWDEDPTVWQRPHELIPYGESLVREFEEQYVVEAEGPTVVDLLLSQPGFETATEGFREHLAAMLMARKMQGSPRQIEPVELAQMRALPLVEQLELVVRLVVAAREVFEWMSSKGMDPIPGREKLPAVVSEQDRQTILNASQ